jgi:hypothetical protein
MKSVKFMARGLVTERIFSLVFTKIGRDRVVSPVIFNGLISFATGCYLRKSVIALGLGFEFRPSLVFKIALVYSVLFFD